MADFGLFGDENFVESENQNLNKDNSIVESNLNNLGSDVAESQPSTHISEPIASLYENKGEANNLPVFTAEMQGVSAAPAEGMSVSTTEMQDSVADNNLSSEAQRLLMVMRHEGMNLSQFAQAIGIKISSISHIVKGRNNPSLDIMQRVLRRFQYLSAEWLILGLGEPNFNVSSNSIRVGNSGNDIASHTNVESISNDNRQDIIELEINEPTIERPKPTTENIESFETVSPNTTNIEPIVNATTGDMLVQDDKQTKSLSNDVEQQIDSSRRINVDDIVNRVVERLEKVLIQTGSANTIDSQNEVNPQQGNSQSEPEYVETVETNKERNVVETDSRHDDKREDLGLSNSQQLQERIGSNKGSRVTKIIVFYSDNTFEQFYK